MNKKELMKCICEYKCIEFEEEFKKDNIRFDANDDLTYVVFEGVENI